MTRHLPVVPRLLLIVSSLLLALPLRSEEAVTILPTLEVRGFMPLRHALTLDLQEPRYGAAVVAAGDYLYVIGGSNDHGTRLDTIERVDLKTGKSTPWARLQLARRHHRAVVLGNNIYVLGGTSLFAQGDSGLRDELPEYSEEEDKIFSDAGKHNASNADQFVTESDQNRNGRANTPQGAPPAVAYETSMEIIDLTTGQGHFGPPLTIGKALFGCVTLDNKIYVIGGQHKRGDSVYSTNTTEVFDPVADRWSPGVNMPTARRCTAVVVDDFVMVLGGREGNRRVATVEVMNPREKVWRRLPDLTERRSPSAVVWLGHRLFLFGDQDTGRRQLTYDLRSKQLEPYPMPFPDGDFATAVAHQGRIYVVGGANLFAKTVNAAIQVFDAIPDPTPAANGAK